MGRIGCFSCEKFQFDVVAWTFALALSRFAPSFVRQSNSPKCTQIVENRPKHEFRLQWGGSGAFIAKISDGTSWHEGFHQLTRFTLSVVTQPNRTESTQIIRNTPKHEFRVQWAGSGVFVAKIQRDFVARTFAPVWPVLLWVLYGNQRVPNAPK